MDDERLRQRLNAADPARHRSPADSWTDNLLEATMRTTSTLPPTADGPADRSGRNRLLWAGAAAAAVAVAGGTAVAVWNAADTGPSPSRGPAAVMDLRLPDGTSMSSCAAEFDPQFLRDMSPAFRGTVTEVSDTRVLFEVTDWYAGGEAEQVRLAVPDTATTSIDGVEFRQGGDYLVTASDGTVNGCGYTTAWTGEVARTVDRAFGR